MYDDHDKDMYRAELMDWRDFQKTPRKIIARRQLGGRFQPQEAMAMRAAHELLLEGSISIITKISPGPIVTYVAERVK
jgi:hypothetical protein